MEPLNNVYSIISRLQPNENIDFNDPIYVRGWVRHQYTDPNTQNTMSYWLRMDDTPPHLFQTTSTTLHRQQNLPYLDSDDDPPTDTESKEEPTIQITDLALEPTNECCICMETDKTITQMCKLNCGHLFCICCMCHHLTKSQACPLCRTSVEEILVQNEEALADLQHAKQALAQQEVSALSWLSIT